MTVKDFVQAIQTYYALVYEQAERPWLLKYLEGRTSEYLERLLWVTIRRHSKVYKRLPDVAKLEELRAEVISELWSSRVKLETARQRMLLAKARRERAEPHDAMQYLRELLERLTTLKSVRRAGGDEQT